LGIWMAIQESTRKNTNISRIIYTGNQMKGVQKWLVFQEHIDEMNTLKEESKKCAPL